MRDRGPAILGSIWAAPGLDSQLCCRVESTADGMTLFARHKGESLCNRQGRMLRDYAQQQRAFLIWISCYELNFCCI